MSKYFDQVAVEDVKRTAALDEVNSLVVARLKKEGDERLVITPEEHAAMKNLAKSQEKIRAIRAQAAATLGIPASFNVQKFGDTFQIEFHKRNDSWAFIDRKGLYQIYFTARNLSSGKLHYLSEKGIAEDKCKGITHERLRDNAPPTQILDGENKVEDVPAAMQARLKHRVWKLIREEAAPAGTECWGSTVTSLTPSVDGPIRYIASLQKTWDFIHDLATGNIGSGGTAMFMRIQAWNATDWWGEISRNGSIIDSSSITGIVSAADFNGYATLKTDNFGGGGRFDLVDFTPASDAAIVTGDFDQLGATPFSSITYAAWTVGAFNVFDINATGLAAMNFGGNIRIGFRVGFDTDDSPPAWQSLARFDATLRTIEQSGTAFDPFLDVTHEEAPAGGAGGGIAAAAASGLVPGLKI